MCVLEKVIVVGSVLVIVCVIVRRFSGGSRVIVVIGVRRVGVHVESISHTVLKIEVGCIGGEIFPSG